MAQFVRVITIVLYMYISHIYCLFLDNIRIKGPKTRYNNKEIEPSLRRFVIKYIQNLNTILYDIERANLTIYSKKLQLIYQRINIVRYITNEDRRYPDKARVRKISLQPTPEYQKEVRIQIGVVTYFRIWVEDFSIIYKLLFILLRKDAIFIQTTEHQQAKDRIT